MTGQKPMNSLVEGMLGERLVMIGMRREPIVV